jgi:hypothetical protein
MKAVKGPPRRERIRGKNKRLERIIELSDHLYEEQYNEDTVPVDIGDVIELICLIADQLKEISEK